MWFRLSPAQDFIAGMEAGVNRFPKFLRSKNRKAKNGRDAVFRPRKG
jgi:hypothetical protein